RARRADRRRRRGRVNPRPARSPVCWNSGACCNFGAYGHRLYVTTLEVAYYLAGGPAAGLLGRDADAGPPDAPGEPAGEAEPSGAVTASPRSLPLLVPPVTADACPHAVGRRCQVRDRRPLGCRVFYCDPHARDWQGPFTEQCLQELKRLHWELAVPYCYVDWMTVLRTLADAR
ncbi:MAG: hypothetical protein HRF43_18450, partial [Phycisphaerae bacterium]